jgi:hypothetical protein
VSWPAEELRVTRAIAAVAADDPDRASDVLAHSLGAGPPADASVALPLVARYAPLLQRQGQPARALALLRWGDALGDHDAHAARAWRAVIKTDLVSALVAMQQRPAALAAAIDVDTLVESGALGVRNDVDVANVRALVVQAQLSANEVDAARQSCARWHAGPAESVMLHVPSRALADACAGVPAPAASAATAGPAPQSVNDTHERR